MATIDLNQNTAAVWIGRIENIDGDSTRQWGTMTPAQMFAHLNLGIKASLEEIEIGDHSTFLFRLLRPVLFSGFIPMPKGSAKTAPEYIADKTGTALEERAALIETIGRFNTMCKDKPDATPLHPLFGIMTLPQWQRGHGLHMDHHLTQFGA